MRYIFLIYALLGLLFPVIADEMSATNPKDSVSSLADRAASAYFVDEGRQLLNQGRYRDALTKFREAYNKDQFSPRATFWLAQTHYILSNYGYALKYASLSQELSNKPDGETFLLLGELYHRKDSLETALKFMDLADEHLSRRRKKAARLEDYRNQVKFAMEMRDVAISHQKNLLEFGVNSGYDDYGFLLAPDHKTAFFISRRPDTKDGGLNPEDQSFFEDTYRVVWDEENQEWSGITNDLERLNSAGFDAVNHLTKDGNTMYLTVNTSIVDVPTPTRSSDICVAEFTKQERWTKPKPIDNKSINSSFFDGAATLTDDENTMYFVSDRRGSRSKLDIYVVQREGKNWGEAQPLPDNINSRGNETTPYITPDGKYLFFSSDGHLGMGGYDIFVSKSLGNNRWSDPINLGPTFNTVNNDTHFRYYEDLARAYFSAYRLQDNKASIDIFEIDLKGWGIPQPPKEEK
jgi:tetratricopeptide (TPR) repeat protein